MKHYIDITILPSDDIGVHFLWSKLMMQVHLALVEIQDSNKQVPIAVSFPNYRMNTVKPGFLGNKLRLFSVNKADLERLNIHKWLSRLTDYLHIKNIADVPADVDSFENFNRRQKAGSPDRHIRRRMKRHNETFEQASQHFVDYEMSEEDKALPFIKMKSLGSDNDFNMSVIRKTVALNNAPVMFNTYGLSKQGCLPKF
ncbi:type I-F CRISPR-associated endoribonuclease Cas6/Csy4 [Aliiglaciecola lipolytica]|uniref:CRISPR-associated Csy4 family protein n=1 Tax=Aliiglaciecola lipolytica E3 TaxID=1127673 RepID=K6X5F0_9ALTE|nr:type I-F CRISPR-associated endoribonuclease Cas6/Csy4 [Aliiglaciecola lipolytica]GAC15829.1 CRISPR-associated Csy4 family protein [Aliiglaciecola lipolytica E3]